MAWKDCKRKKELVKALKEGKTVLYFQKILNSPHWEKGQKVTSLRGESITHADGISRYIEGDYFQIIKQNSLTNKKSMI